MNEEQDLDKQFEDVCNLPTDTPEQLTHKLDMKEDLILQMLQRIERNLNT